MVDGIGNGTHKSCRWRRRTRIEMHSVSQMDATAECGATEMVVFYGLASGHHVDFRGHLNENYSYGKEDDRDRIMDELDHK